MSDLISRQAAIDILRQMPLVEVMHDVMLIDKAEAMTELMLLPPAELGTNLVKELPPAEPKRGKWIHHPEIGWGETWLCDQCGEKTTSTVMGNPRANFCPNCGAKMEVNNESN